MLNILFMISGKAPNRRPSLGLRLVEVAVAQPQNFEECRRCKSPGHLEPELLIPEVFAAEEIFRVQFEILNSLGEVLSDKLEHS